MSITNRIRARLTTKNPYVKNSYSQCGEDMIIAFIFEQMRKPKISYLDIGSHHPEYLSNTAFFYENGSHGVCIEPDPFLFKAIKEKRKNDICLNAGVGIGKETEADFYIMSARTLNTFSKEEAENMQAKWNKKIEEVIRMPLLNINDIIEKYLAPYPNFVSLDVEGLDIEILRMFDFKKYRPEVFCIETITYTEDNNEEKIIPTIEFMKQQGYFVYADTYINSIFVDKKSWASK
jgi:FkbM family methyltransferase